MESYKKQDNKKTTLFFIKNKTKKDYIHVYKTNKQIKKEKEKKSWKE